MLWETTKITKATEKVATKITKAAEVGLVQRRNN